MFFTLKHKYRRDNKTMLIHKLNVTKGYQNTLNSIHNKPSNWGLSGRKFGKHPQNDQACTRCGSHHPGAPCKAGWGLCYNCGKAGHKATNCPEKQKQGAGRHSRLVGCSPLQL